jgi:hypothetical protein
MCYKSGDAGGHLNEIIYDTCCALGNEGPFSKVGVLKIPSEEREEKRAK